MNNLTVRTISSIVFTIVMVAGLLFNPLAFGGLFIVVLAVSMQEFYNISLWGRYVVQQKIAIFTAAAFFTLICCWRMGNLDGRWIAAAVLPLILMTLSALFRKDHSDFGLMAYIYAGFLYIAVPVCLLPFFVFIYGVGYSGYTLLSLFIIIWLCDVGAYCFGTAFGQKPTSRKLAPSISPKKSWWGFWGGVLSGVLVSVALYFTGLLPHHILHCIALGVIISSSAVCGDLIESLWKRYFGVKDSGNCIPGHGGMLDRFDSSLIALPLAFIYMSLFNLI